MSSVIQVSQVVYPESDGKPMGETDYHRKEIIRQIELLEDYYRGQKVYVSGDLLVYYVEGDPRKYVVPDAFVVKGIVPQDRRTYKIWVEGKAPDMVIETTSRRTRRKDRQIKPELYARLGVKEYFLFDPLGEYLDPPLQGFRMDGGAYQRIELAKDGGLDSHELQLRLRLGDGHLDFVHRNTGERLLTRDERLRQETEARQAAEAEVARLRAELDRRPPAPE
ncbi:MAG: Uma2 family endonuclease [Planctomycetaceae bacterium]|nr:MAG: Uma2 family endonuclease [Planctomycetaceae bacterium]